MLFNVVAWSALKSLCHPLKNPSRSMTTNRKERTDDVCYQTVAPIRPDGRHFHSVFRMATSISANCLPNLRSSWGERTTSRVSRLRHGLVPLVRHGFVWRCQRKKQGQTASNYETRARFHSIRL